MDGGGSGGLCAATVVPLAGDLVEALVRAGDRARARVVLRWLEERAAATGLGYPAATAARCRGLLATDAASAVQWFGRARAQPTLRSLPFEHARTLLCEAEVLRRMRQPSAARPLLRQARHLFTQLGARTWTARVQRASSRRPAALSGRWPPSAPPRT